MQPTNPLMPEASAASGSLMSPDETYFAPQADGELEEVPPGATPKGVHDGIDIRISEGEIVVPEDVARWHGLKWFMQAREEAKEGLAQMASEGLIKRPEGTIAASEMEEPELDFEEEPQSGLMAPEFAEGGIAEVADELEDYGRYGDSLLAHITPEEAELLKQHGGAGTRNPVTGLLEFYDAESNGTATDTGNPTGGDNGGNTGGGDSGNIGGFNPAMNPEMGGSRQARSQDAAIANAASMNSGIAGQLASWAGGKAEVALDDKTGMFGTSYTGNPAQAVGSIAGMATGIPGLGTAAGYLGNALGIGTQHLGTDWGNNGLQGAIDSGVQGFGYGGDGLNNDNGNEDFNAGITALQALMARPY